MPSAEFELVILASTRLQTQTVDRVATEIERSVY
jgi:hypothetical protein